MSDVSATKRKADELEPAADAEGDLKKKRAKNDEEAVVEEAGDGGDEDSEGDLENELKDLAEDAPVLERRTRGIRVNYAQLKGEIDDDDEEEEEEEDEDDDDQEEEPNGEVNKNGKENGFAEKGSEDEAGEEQDGDEDEEE